MYTLQILDLKKLKKTQHVIDVMRERCAFSVFSGYNKKHKWGGLVH